MFSALLDTCVLWPSLQRDFLLSLAVERLYRPLWSEAILEELRYVERNKLINRGQAESDATARADRLVAVMAREFDDALVSGWEPLEGTFGLPDPDDEHVLAAAVMGGAGVIVTENDKDFPRYLVPLSLDVLDAKEFAANTADVDPERVVTALQAMSERHGRPPREPKELLALLVERYDMGDVAEIVEPLL